MKHLSMSRYAWLIHLARELPQQSTGSNGPSPQRCFANQMIAKRKGRRNPPRASFFGCIATALLSRVPQTALEWRKVQPLWNHGRHLDVGML